MPGSSFDNATPQFGTAEYVGRPETDVCRFCQQPVGGSYYRINGALACASCAERAQREGPKDSHAVFMRALIFGIGAAIMGLILYAAFIIMTGLMIGYVSLAVGWIVGKAMKKGSNGLGGRRYQITAALLTYAAVSMAAVPIAISYQRGHRGRQAQVQQQHNEEQSPGQQPGTQPTPAKPRMSMGAALAYLAMLGLASPFLELQDPVHGLIGLVILFVGIQIAWKITAGRLEISGHSKTPRRLHETGGSSGRARQVCVHRHS